MTACLLVFANPQDNDAEHCVEYNRYFCPVTRTLAQIVFPQLTYHTQTPRKCLHSYRRKRCMEDDIACIYIPTCATVFVRDELQLLNMDKPTDGCENRLLQISLFG